MLRIFRKFDPRIASELRAQRKTIALGLLCAILTSLLTTATIPLIGKAAKAVASASPIAGVPGESAAVQTTVLTDEEKRIAANLGVTAEQFKQARSRSTTGKETASQVSERQQRALRDIGILCIVMIGMYGLKYWFTRGQTWFISKAATQLVADLRVRLFAKLQRLPVAYFNEKRAGAIQSVLSNDVGIYQSSVMIVRDSIDGPIKAVGAIITIFVMQWQLALVAMVAVPILAVVITRNGRKMKLAQAQVQDDYADLVAMTNESLQGTRVVKAFAAEERIASIYEGLVHQTFLSSMQAVKRLASLRPFVEFIGACALSVVLYVCGLLAVRGNLNIGDIVALVYALDVINQGARTIGYANSTYNQVLAATDRIYEQILDIPEDLGSNSESLILDNPRGEIEFRNVSFRYPDGTEALKNVSFTVHPGTSVALVGPSGAGKSTITDLLLRFYDPTEGEIYFDKVDIRKLQVPWLRSQIGVVPQHTFLFAGTIADNIRLGCPDAPDEAIQVAGRAAHANAFVDRMPNKYDTVVGEHGVGLSGGERQRVAIARAIVRKPTLLLLDEATSALDAESEQAVQEALEEIMKQRTSLFIAHRLTLAARLDQILMMRRGEILEIGSHQELMAKNGPYAELYRTFTSGVFDAF